MSLSSIKITLIEESEPLYNVWLDQMWAINTSREYRTLKNKKKP